MSIFNARFLRRTSLALAACALVGGAAVKADAAVIGFELKIGVPSGDKPDFTLTNISSAIAGTKITAFTFTIGDTSKNFDRVTTVTNNGIGTITLNNPDAINDAGSLRADLIDLSYVDFDPTDSHFFDTDIDPDAAPFSTAQDFRTIFFNNGGLPNSVATVTFETEIDILPIGGVGPQSITETTILTLTLPDDNSQNVPGQFTFKQTVGGAIPEPASMSLLGLGLVGAGALAWRKRRKAERAA